MTNTPTVTMYRTGDSGTVVIENEFATDQGDLWQAITDPERLARWLVTVSGDPSDGGTVELRFTSGWEGTGVVQICTPPERLVVETSGSDGEVSTISATLTPTISGTHLRIEESGLPVSGLTGHGAGWQLHVEDLGTVLGGDTPAPMRERWVALAPTFDESRILQR